MAEQHTSPDTLEVESSQATVAPLAVPLETVPLNVVLASIVRDSRKQPETYLDQVVVPHGGE